MWNMINKPNVFCLFGGFFCYSAKQMDKRCFSAFLNKTLQLQLVVTFFCGVIIIMLLCSLPEITLKGSPLVPGAHNETKQ